MSGDGFSLALTEPEGWTIDFRSAAQIANFVMHPVGSRWRESPVVVFGSFKPKTSHETLDSFAARGIRGLEEACPFHEIQDFDLELEGPRQFLIQKHSCPNVRYEIIAITEAPRFFVTFVLSSSDPHLIEGALPSFQKILTSFSWTAYTVPTPQGGPVFH